MSNRNRFKLSLATLLAVFALLTTGTLIVGKTVSRFEATTGNLSEGFPGPPGRQVISENWKEDPDLEGIDFGQDKITVERMTPGLSWAEVRYPLPEPGPERGSQLLVGGVMSSSDVKVGEEEWHVALFGAFFYDDSGKRINRAGVTVQALAGTSSPLHHVRSMPVPIDATEFGVLLRLFQTTGRAEVHSVESVLVKPWIGFTTTLYTIASAWALFALAVLVALAERKCLLIATIPLAVIATILVGVSLPGEHLRSALMPLYKATQHFNSVGAALGLTTVAKIGHALGFAALAFFALAMRRRLGATFLGIALFAVILAIATESGQLFLTGRNGRLADIWIDLGGAVAGAVLYFIVVALLYPFTRRTRGA